jgi:hypothetical protein
MNYHRIENGIKILTILEDVIDKHIQRKIENDIDYKKRFRHPLLEEINVKYKDNPYGLDVNMIPVRLKERNKQSAYGWYSDSYNNIVNINTDMDMLLLQQRDLFDITKQRILKRYARSCTSRSMFTRIMNIVAQYKEMQANEASVNDEANNTEEEDAFHESEEDSSDDSISECVYDSDDDII